MISKTEHFTLRLNRIPKITPLKPQPLKSIFLYIYNRDPNKHEKIEVFFFKMAMFGAYIETF